MVKRVDNVLKKLSKNAVAYLNDTVKPDNLSWSCDQVENGFMAKVKIGANASYSGAGATKKDSKDDLHNNTNILGPNIFK